MLYTYSNTYFLSIFFCLSHSIYCMDGESSDSTHAKNIKQPSLLMLTAGYIIKNKVLFDWSDYRITDALNQKDAFCSLEQSLTQKPNIIDYEKGILISNSGYMKYIGSLSKIPNYEQLTAIDLSHNTLELINLKNFNPCTHLTLLNLSHNQITRIQTHKAYNTHLKKLILNHNLLNDQNIFGKCARSFPFLKTLDLSHNNFKDINLNSKDNSSYSTHNSFSQLKFLSMAHNHINRLDLNDLHNISSQKSFETLDISNNPITHIIKPATQYPDGEDRIIPKIVCTNLNQKSMKLIKEYAVSTKKSFSDRLYSSRTVFTSFIGPLIMVIPLCFILNSSSTQDAIPYLLGSFGASWLCGASSITLATICSHTDDTIFYDHYHIKNTDDIQLTDISLQ